MTRPLATLLVVGVLAWPLLATAGEKTSGGQQQQARTNCPKSVTQVVKPKNVVTVDGETSEQRVVETAPKLDPGCKPLVSTRVVTPLNLATGRNSTADQEVDSTAAPAGSLVTRDVVSGTNKAVGAHSTANQGITATRKPINNLPNNR